MKENKRTITMQCPKLTDIKPSDIERINHAVQVVDMLDPTDPFKRIQYTTVQLIIVLTDEGALKFQAAQEKATIIKKSA